MRRARCLTFGLTAFVLATTGAAGVAQAQTGTPPARYLNWAGRGDVAMPVAASPDASASRAAPAARRPNRVIPHGGAYEVAPPPPVAAEAPRRTLTPASAWLHTPTPAPAPQPPAPPPPPPRVAAPAPAPAPVQPRVMPDFVPGQGGRGQPAPAEAILAAPQPAYTSPSDDPMAPRRDAPIFRMQQAAAAAPVVATPEPAPRGEASVEQPTPRPVAMVAANPADRPTAQTSRYYSVHRQNGREPDAVALPAPTYVDALAITTPVTIASQDLAQPEPAPTLIRDAQGRVRAQPAMPEGDYQ